MEEGYVYYAFRDIFDKINQDKHKVFKITISCYVIYNDKLYDVLGKGLDKDIDLY